MPPKKAPTTKKLVVAPATEPVARVNKRKATEEPTIPDAAKPAAKRRGRPKNTTALISDEASSVGPAQLEKTIAEQPRRVGTTQHSPRPQRAGRNTDPTGKQAKAAKAAAKRAGKLEKENRQQLQKEKAEAAQDELIAMEVDESFSQAAERAHRVRRISDMVGVPQVESDGGEFAGLADMEFSDDSDSSTAKELNVNNKTKSPTKGKRTALRTQVAVRKLTAKNKRAGKVVQPVASGLNAAWLANSGNKLPQWSPDVGTAINDEAAESTRPDFPPSPSKFDRHAANTTIAKASQRNLRRLNKLVAAPSENITVDVHNAASNTTSKQAQHTVHAKPRREPQITASKPTSCTSTHRGKQSTAVNNHSVFSMPKGTLLVSALPSSVSLFRERYFSTLYSGLYASTQPFDEFVKHSPAFLALSRAAFKKIWPEIVHELEPDDALYLIGCQRVTEKRGKIYNSVLNYLTHFFSLQTWGPESIASWVSYFCKTFGSPIFYEKPVARDGSWNPKDPNYKPPSGFLRSPAMIELGRRFLKDRDMAALDFGPPRGLFVLLLTSFEKAARSHKTGQYVGSDFNEKTCGLWVKQYNKNFNDKSDEWWDRILTPYCDDSDAEEDVDMSMLDGGRAMLPMSP